MELILNKFLSFFRCADEDFPIEILFFGGIDHN